MLEFENPPFAIPTFDLHGKVAIITGSTAGLGYGMAVTLAAYGASVVVNCRYQDRCDAVADEITAMGGRAIAVRGDVRVKAEIDALVATTVERLGRVDIMVSNAGIGITKRVVEMTEEEWDDVINTNLRGVFFCGAAAAKEMIRQGNGGRIINISSAGGLVGTKNIAAYCASKAGVISLSKTMAMEFGRNAITVNSICPGYVPTSINQAPLAIEKVREQILARTALRRLGEVREVSAAVLFLASEGASAVTGACLSVDMGTTCN